MKKIIEHCSCHESFEPQTQPTNKQINNDDTGAYNIPQGTWAINQAFGNPAVSDIFNMTIPSQHMPTLGSTIDPNNIYAVNGLLARLGSPSAYFKQK